MKTVLYINNDRIQIISIKRKGNILKNKICIDIDAQSIVNGVIINNQPIIDKLVQHRKILKNSTVIINSSNIFVKNLKFPNLPKKHLHRVIKNEFSMVDEENIMYGSNILTKDGINTALCCALPVDLAKSYVELLKEARISPKKIHIAQNAIVKFIRTNTQLQRKTFILNIIDGDNLESILFEKGEYKLSNRSRIIPENSSSDYTKQLFSKLSSIIQFNKSEKSQNEFQASYYIGLSSAELVDLQEYTSREIGDLEIRGFDEILKIGDLANDFFYPFMGFYNNKKDINVLKIYKKRMVNNKIEKDKNITKITSIILLVFLLVFGSYSYFKTINYFFELENTRITKFLSQKSTKKTLDQILYRSRRNKELPQTISEIENAYKVANLDNSFDSEKLIKILSEAEKSIAIESLIFDAAKKTISIKGKGDDEYSSSIFISNIKATNLFQKVEYGGYSAITENVYIFNVVCTLK